MAEDKFPNILRDMPAADERLRAHVPLVREGDRNPPEYPITEASHPELMAAFKAFLGKAGISEPYGLVMLGGGFGGAGADFNRKLIGIGDKRFLEESFEEVVSTLSHEVGHIWRKEHPDIAGPVSEKHEHLSPEQRGEIEADLVGVCLTESKEDAVKGFKNPGIRPLDGRPDSLPLQERINAIENFDLSRCSQLVEWNPEHTPESSVPNRTPSRPGKRR